MQSLKLEKSTAVRLFKGAPQWFQEVLLSTFGPECFSGKIIDRIKTFEDACAVAGVDPDSYFSVHDTEDETAFKKLKLIIKVINEDWVPDWNNTDEQKWYPWFQVASGFGFSGSNYDCTYSFTSVGSRLCFSSEEKSDYVAKQFIDLYKQFLN